MHIICCIAQNTSLKKGRSGEDQERSDARQSKKARRIKHGQHDERDSTCRLDMHKRDCLIFKAGAARFNGSALRRVTTDIEMNKICLVHANDLRRLFQARPPKREIWYPVLDRERAKRIRLLHLPELEDVAAVQEDNQEEENGNQKHGVPITSISHKASQSKDTKSIRPRTIRSPEGKLT